MDAPTPAAPEYRRSDAWIGTRENEPRLAHANPKAAGILLELAAKASKMKIKVHKTEVDVEINELDKSAQNIQSSHAQKRVF